MWFGYRKRTYTRNQGHLQATLSAHVYLGLALLVIATLHTGFHFGWNIHTLAYVLMCLVIASGAVGTFCYIHYPRLMTRNRSSSSTADMLASIASLDGELRNAAMTLDDTSAALIRRTTEVTLIGGSWWRQLSGRYPNCATQRALALLDRGPREREPQREALVRTIRIRLDQRAFLLGRLRRDIRYKALMDAWLYLHVPLAFALLAALVAHVLAIFFLW
jgi:hypothetical protein